MHEYFEHGEAKRFFKLAALAVGLLALFLAVKTLDAWKDWREPNATPNTIVVNGYGEAFATPDLATFSFAVSADAASVATAQEDVTGKMNAVVEALKNLGIEGDDIRTTDYSVYPKYVYETLTCMPGVYCPPGRQVPDGYSVMHSVEVKVRDTNKAGEALAAAGTKGATNISSLVFTLDDRDAVQDEARDEAVEEARKKAESLADSLGVNLGRVVDFSDSSYAPYPFYSRLTAQEGFGGADMASAAPALPQGQNKFTSNVTITYEIR